MSSPRKHHYISQFYLKGFLNEKDRLINVYDKKKKKSFRSRVNNIAHKRDFNTVSSENNKYFVEEDLSKIESSVAPVFEKMIIREEFPLEKDFNFLFNFIAILYAWNPKQRELYLGFEKEEIDLGNKTREENLENRVRKDSIIKDEFNSLNDVLPCICKRFWYLYKSDKETGEFITSDNPVSLIAPESLQYAGIESRKTDLIFPISQYLCMVGTYEKYTDLIIMHASKEFVKTINRITYDLSYRQVYYPSSVEKESFLILS